MKRIDKLLRERTKTTHLLKKHQSAWHKLPLNKHGEVDVDSNEFLKYHNKHRELLNYLSSIKMECSKEMSRIKNTQHLTLFFRNVKRSPKK